MRRTLLVTGDDFGLSPGVNAAIAASHREGILTSASVMVTGPALAEAVGLARELPALSTGLHLVLSGHEVRAASKREQIPDLVDRDGRFSASPAWAGITDVLFWRRRGGQIEREIRTQIERFLETGLPLDHVDGHHHLHMHPLVFDVLLRCMEEYRVPWVRLMDEDAVGRSSRGPTTDDLVPAIFHALSRRVRARLNHGRRVGATDRVYGLRASGRLGADEIQRLLARTSARSVELYGHPNRDTEAGRCEEAAFRAPGVREALYAAGFRLVNSRALGRGEAVAA